MIVGVIDSEAGGLPVSETRKAQDAFQKAPLPSTLQMFRFPA